MTPDTAHHAQSRQSVFTPSLNWLFALIPVSVALERAHAPDPVLFFSAALAIGPIARLIVLATEQLAVRTGDAIGRLLNATFGNAPELIIALVALKAGLFDMVRASIIGAILANLMLATGLAFLLGGLRYHTPGIQRRRGAARLYSSMMLISARRPKSPGRRNHPHRVPGSNPIARRPARPRVPIVLGFGHGGTLEIIGMRLEQENEIQRVGRQQHESRSQIHELFFAERAVRREEAVEGARDAETHCGSPLGVTRN